MPDGQDNAGKDVEPGGDGYQRHLGVVRVGQDAANERGDDGDGGRDGGDGVDGLDAVALLLEPQGEAAVGGHSVGLGEEEGEGDEDPEVPAGED